MSGSKVQCKECGSVSTTSIGESKLLHCPKCHALTTRWTPVVQKPVSAYERCMNGWRQIVPI